MASTRAKRGFLVAPQELLRGSKLPSNEEFLGVVLHHHHPPFTSLHEACTVVTGMVAQYWGMARIPTTQHYNIIRKAEHLYHQYKLIPKNRKRSMAAQIQRRRAFAMKLRNLFDVAHQEALKMMTNAEDQAFLLAQREPGRRGNMGSVDRDLAAQERRAQRLERRQAFQRRTSERASTSFVVVRMESELNGSSSDSSPERAKPVKRSRASKSIVTPALSMTLERTNVSDRRAAFILTEAARSLGQNVKQLTINRSTIRRERRRHRQQQASKLKGELKTSAPLIVHWDGKLMEDLTSKKQVYRLPILVSGGGDTKLLNVAKLPSGTGQNTASAVVKALEERGVTNQVSGMAFDTYHVKQHHLVQRCLCPD